MYTIQWLVRAYMRIAEIKDYPEYKISDTGVVYNKKGVELKGWLWRHHKRLRKRVTLFYYKNGIRYRKVVSVARLVALAFIPNLENKPDVNHMDGDTTNDNYKNLEWVTKKENNIHALELGLIEYHNHIIIKHKKTGQIKKFNSIMACKRFLGLKRTCNIYKAIQEKNHTVKGYYINKKGL